MILVDTSVIFVQKNKMRKLGTVKFFNREKSFGFIIDDETNDEIFVHKSGLKAGVSINQDQRVSYTIEKGKKGLNACNVERA